MSNLDTAKAMIAAYNAQDVDTYVSYMTDEASEANYRGAVVRAVGPDGAPRCDRGVLLAADPALGARRGRR